MKNKIVLSSAILLVLLAVFVCANLTFNVDYLGSSDALTRNVTTATINVTNNYSVPVIVSPSVGTLEDEDENEISFTITPSSATISPGSVASFNISYIDFPEDYDEFYLGSYDFPVTFSITNATESISETQVATIDLINEWCESGNNGNLDITNINDDSSDDEWEWEPLDEVTITFKIKNNYDDDLDVAYEIDLYDKDENEFLGLDGDGGAIEDTISIDEDSRETISVDVKVPVELEESSDRYVLYIKAYEDGEEDTECNEYNSDEDSDTQISINRESRRVRITSLDFPDFVSCGENALITAEVANIGSNTEDSIKIVARNSELGLEQTQIISKLNEDSDPKEISFSFEIPSNATEKDYTISFDVYYYYKKSTGEYQSVIKSVESGTLKVQGSCVASTSANLIISSSLESTAKAGEELSVKANLRNTGTSEATYAISISGYNSWASNLKLSQSEITLSAGESKDVYIYLTPNSDVSGEKSFTIQAISGAQIKEQQVVVSGIEASSTFSFGNNWYLWLIIGINVILIVVIIIVAISMSKK